LFLLRNLRLNHHHYLQAHHPHNLRASQQEYQPRGQLISRPQDHLHSHLAVHLRYQAEVLQVSLLAFPLSLQQLSHPLNRLSAQQSNRRLGRQVYPVIYRAPNQAVDRALFLLLLRR
jgi:hypothetical protein